jgi:homoserine O-acetyltransferase
MDVEKTIVKTQYIDYSDGLKLVVDDVVLKPIRVAYEVYGDLESCKDNVILVCHALTGGAHAAFYNSPNDKKPGWWDIMIGPNKALDTEKYCVICSNILGSCYGTTGPSSINPETGKPYGLSFPVITVADMVNLQKKLMDTLGIKRLKAVIGGSLGGMQVLEWSVRYPEMVESAIVIASAPALSPQGIAFNLVGREAIMSDPNWHNGDYYEKGVKPNTGLSIARMIGHITYLSKESMRKKFGRKLQGKDDFSFDWGIEFAVESYLQYKGRTFVERFDANSYLYITRAMDYYDLAREWGDGDLVKAFKRANAKYLIISFTSDWLFPTSQSIEMVSALLQAKKQVSFWEIESEYGHDAFLLEKDTQTRIIKAFLQGIEKK